MQHLADERGLDWQVDSAGTGGWHVGEGPDRRSVRTAKNHGIDISGQVCRKFRKSDFEDFDYICDGQKQFARCNSYGAG